METNKAELNQIEKYGGFYIGRYEAGVSTLNKDTNEFIDSVKFKNDASLKDAVAIQSGENSWTLQNYNFTARQNATVVTTGVNNVVGGNIVEKANSIPYYHTDYYTAVEMSTRLYSNNDYVSSGLVTGTQWDMMLKFMQDSGVNLAQPDWGNYDDVQVKNLRGYYTIVVNSGATDGFKDVAGASTQASTGTYIILTTGASEQLKKNNLYEVAGNLWEWTQEAAYVTGVQYSSSEQLNTYMLRGGAAITGKACCPYYRGFSYGPNTEVEFGFRPVLYIK